MTIANVRDYIAAIAKRKRLQGLLKEGTKQFAGYGRDLFEAGMHSNIEALSAAISEYEIHSGYTQLAPRDFWTTHVKNEVIELAGGTVFVATCPVASGPSPFASARFVEVWEGGPPVLQVRTCFSPFNLAEPLPTF